MKSLCTTFSFQKVNNDEWYINWGASGYVVMRQEQLQNKRKSINSEVLGANN